MTDTMRWHIFDARGELTATTRYANDAAKVAISYGPGATVRVNILPPEYLWDGDIRLDDCRPDPTHWCVFADGELIARIERQEDVGAALVPLLTARPDQ